MKKIYILKSLFLVILLITFEIISILNIDLRYEKLLSFIVFILSLIINIVNDIKNKQIDKLILFYYLFLLIIGISIFL